jgi:hypothetical protein
MAKQRRAKSITSGSPQSVGRLDRPMKFAGSSAGPIDPSTLPAPEHPSAQWAGVALDPVRPRQ